jgi:outer membrane protein TolC
MVKFIYLNLIVIFFMIISLLAREVTIAVVKDGPSSEEQLVPQIESELNRLVKDDATIRFKTDPSFDAGWDPDRIPDVIQNALRDRSVDMIMAIGALVTKAAADPDLILSKPFLSTFVQRADLTGMPYHKDRPPKINFSMIMIPQRAERDFRAFSQLANFKKLYVGITSAEEQISIDSQTGLKRYEDSLGIKIEIVPISDDITSSLSGLDKDIEAFFLTRLSHLSDVQRKELIDELNVRKIPSFSLLGLPDVEIGVLSGLAPDITDQVVRRVALNFHRLIRGEKTSDLSMTLTVDSRLVINARTASSIGFVPSAETKVMANFLFEEALKSDLPTLNLPQTFKLAEDGNISLSISDVEVETSLNDKLITRSPLLPQVNAEGTYNRLNPRSEALKEVFPDAISVLNVSLSQMIYDDRLISDFRSSDRIYEARQQKREMVRLDAMAKGGDAYLFVVLADLSTKIEADNLGLTRDNLELARLRVDVGYSGKDEVYRWQAELSQNQSKLIRSEADIENRQIDLNQILGLNQYLRWEVEEIQIDEDIFYFLEGRLDPVYDNTSDWGKFRNFIVQFAVTNAPEIRTIDKLIEAQNIQVGQRTRRWFLPILSLNFGYNYELYRTPEMENVDKTNYTFDLRASYPIFNGLDRLYEVQREKSVLTGYERERQLLSDLVERRTRTSMRRIESSFPTIKLYNNAAKNAERNLVLVQDKYAQGIVNVTDLLEAQNQTLSAKLNAVAAQYNYLIDLVGFQRAISWFEDEKSEEAKDAFLNKVEEALQQ